MKKLAILVFAAAVSSQADTFIHWTDDPLIGMETDLLFSSIDAVGTGDGIIASAHCVPQTFPPLVPCGGAFTMDRTFDVITPTDFVFTGTISAVVGGDGPLDSTITGRLVVSGGSIGDFLLAQVFDEESGDNPLIVNLPAVTKTFTLAPGSYGIGGGGGWSSNTPNESFDGTFTLSLTAADAVVATPEPRGYPVLLVGLAAILYRARRP